MTVSGSIWSGLVRLGFGSAGLGLCVGDRLPIRLDEKCVVTSVSAYKVFQRDRIKKPIGTSPEIKKIFKKYISRIP